MNHSMADLRLTRVLIQMIFISFCCSIYQGDPRKLRSSSPKDVHVLMNEKAKVTYRTSILRPTTITFVKVSDRGDVTTIIDRPEGRIYYEIKIEDSGKTLRATLHFRSIIAKDIGQYQCRIYEEDHMTTSHSFFVKIIKSLPTPSIRASESNPSTGSTITLVCTLPYKLQSPAFFWAKDGVDLVLDARHKVVSEYLTIRKVHATDEGSYRCIVWNAKLYSEWSHSSLIIVKPVIAIVPMALTKVEGETANISCLVVSGDTSNMKLLLIHQGPNSTKINENKSTFKNLSISSGKRKQTFTYQCLLVLHDLNNPVSWSPLAQLTIVQSKFPTCPRQLESGVLWFSTAVGIADVKRCPGNSTGQATRRCKKGATWDDPDFGNCTSSKFIHLLLQAEAIRLGNYTPSYNSSEILELLNNSTKTNQNTVKALYGGDIDITVEILSNLANYSEANTVITSDKDQQNFLEICSNILEPANKERWIQFEDQIEKGSKSLWNRLVAVVDRYGFHLTNQMASSQYHKLIEKNNIVMKLDKISSKHNEQAKKDGLRFDSKNFESSLFLPSEVFSNTSADYQIVSLMYKTLNAVMRLGNNVTQVYKENAALSSNTTVVTSVVSPLPNRRFKEKVKIVLKNKMVRPEPVPQRTCVFWREGLPYTWGSDGCSLVTRESDKHVTTCECDHLTMFAAIMDPYGEPIPEEHRKALEYISTVGCAVSLIGVLLTIFVLLFFWKTLKTPRTVLLMNICVAIAAVCVLVIAEGTARDTQVGCTLMAVFLHYFLLTVFCWMLCEGVFLYLMIIKIISVDIEEKLGFFMLFGWGFPLAVVGISLAATRGQGYGYQGNPSTCWLTVENGLIWACIAPAIVVLLINIVIYVLVIRRMMTTRHVQNKSRDEKLRMGVKATAVILPVLGITWLFGLLAFNSATLAFKYFFAIFNSLQGLMIFIFHCLLNHQVQNAFRCKLGHFSSAAFSTGSSNKDKNVNSIQQNLQSLEPEVTV